MGPFRRFAPVVAVVVTASLVAAAGCSGGGGGGGGGKKSSGGAGASAGSGTPGGSGGGSGSGSGSGMFTGTDTTPPSISNLSPGRGAFVSGSPAVTLSGNAQDGQSGLRSLEVNGAPVAVAANGDWSVPVTLAFGTNLFTAKAVDNQGNSTYVSWACLYAPQFVPLSDLVPDAAGGRLSKDAIDLALPLVLNAMPGGGALGQALVGQTFNTGIFGSVQITAVNLPQQPSVSVAPKQGALDVSLLIPVLGVDAVTTNGATIEIDATNVRADLTVEIALDQNRNFDVTVPSASVAFGTLSVTSSDPTIQSLIQALGPSLPSLVAPLLASSLQSALPPALESALNGLGGPRTVTFAGVSITVEGKPSAFSIDPGGITAGADGNVTAGPVSALAPPPAPGSPSRSTGAGFPTPSARRDLSIFVSEAAFCRAHTAAWQAGAFAVRIDQQFLNQLGIALPFPLDASFLLPFFPALQALATPGQPVPVALEVEALLPPVVEVSGAPSLLTLSWGEVHISVALDFGQGYQDVLTVNLAARVGLDATVSNGLIRFSLGQPASASASILANPLGLAQVDVDQFLAVLVPLALQYGGSALPPLPATGLPFGVQLQNVSVYQGNPPDYLVIEGDL